MNKNEWAAWIQAIGSIGAILVAFGVGWYQARSNEASRRLDRDQADHAAFKLCQEAISDAESALHKYVDAAKERSRMAGAEARRAHNPTGQHLGRLQQSSAESGFEQIETTLAPPAAGQDFIPLNAALIGLKDCLVLSLPARAIVPTARAKRDLALFVSRIMRQPPEPISFGEADQAVMKLMSARDHFKALVATYEDR